MPAPTTQGALLVPPDGGESRWFRREEIQGLIDSGWTLESPLVVETDTGVSGVDPSQAQDVLARGTPIASPGRAEAKRDDLAVGMMCDFEYEAGDEIEFKAVNCKSN